VVDAISANASLFALGRLDESAAALAGNIAAVSAGDNRGAVALHQIAQDSLAFRAAGNLTATTGSLAEYSANVISDIANSGAIADQFAKDRTAFAAALEARITDISGVNMDEELANMLIYQNAFSASARIITTVREMFDTLLDAVG
jgi:flagellar hook-associated protein 1